MTFPQDNKQILSSITENIMGKIKILNSLVDVYTRESLKEDIKKLFQEKEKVFIAKINSEFLLRATKEQEFRQSLNSANISLADGKGVLWAAKFLSLPITKKPLLRQIQATWQMVYSGASLVFYPKYCQYPIPENIPGVEAMYLALEVMIEVDAPVYFFGAEKEVLENAVDIIRDKYPQLVIAGYHEGFGYKDEEIIEDINQTSAALLIVALGSPKQEYWITRYLDRLETVRVAIGEGGSLDFVAGSFKRAPKWMQQVSLEWLWRLLMNRSKTQTGSRTKRVWRAIPIFIYEVVKSKINDGVRG